MAGTIRFPLLSCSLRTPLHSSQHWIRSTSKTSMNAIMSRKSCQVRAAAHEGRTAKTTTVGAADIVDSMGCTKIEDSVESTQQQWNTALLDDFVVHEARLDEELWTAAWLRAESYREEQPFVRYVDSNKKQFAEQEFAALKRRVFGKYGLSICCKCFVAVTREPLQGTQRLETGGLLVNVVGTLDVSLRQVSQAEAFLGSTPDVVVVPLGINMQQPQNYGYIANLCVHKSARRRGIASALLQVAMKVIQNWGLCEVYVHVNATNKPAQALYTKKGFQVLEEESSEGSLEKTVLLRRQI
ncbi:unnamed protein product [Sphagnum jensenii]|uniref:N-acetyltransferase domain-containing protein n=1 Tax=Sphagnum jensenii TaxID=128206 RepID=A0ABP1AGP9_9BRYO